MEDRKRTKISGIIGLALGCVALRAGDGLLVSVVAAEDGFAGGIGNVVDCVHCRRC